jgi:hypothetical protein
VPIVNSSGWAGMSMPSTVSTGLSANGK